MFATDPPHPFLVTHPKPDSHPAPFCKFKHLRVLEFPKRPTLAHAEQSTLGFAISSTCVLEIAKPSLYTLVPVSRDPCHNDLAQHHHHHRGPHNATTRRATGRRDGGWAVVPISQKCMFILCYIAFYIY